MTLANPECVGCKARLKLNEEFAGVCHNPDCPKYYIVQGYALVGGDRQFSEDPISGNNYTRSNDLWKPDSGLVENQSGEKRLNAELDEVRRLMEKLHNVRANGLSHVIDKAKQLYTLIAPHTRLREARMVACAYLGSIRWGHARSLDEVILAYREVLGRHDPKNEHVSQFIAELEGMPELKSDMEEVAQVRASSPDLGRTRRFLGSFSAPAYLISLAEKSLVGLVTAGRVMLLRCEEASGDRTIIAATQTTPELVAGVCALIVARRLSSLNLLPSAWDGRLNSEAVIARRLGLNLAVLRDQLGRVLTSLESLEQAGAAPLSFAAKCRECGAPLHINVAGDFGRDELVCVNSVCDSVLTPRLLERPADLARPEWTVTDLMDLADELEVPEDVLRDKLTKMKENCLDCRKGLRLFPEPTGIPNENKLVWRCANPERCDSSLSSRLANLGVNPRKYKERSEEEIKALASQALVSEKRLTEFLDRRKPEKPKSAQASTAASEGILDAGPLFFDGGGDEL